MYAKCGALAIATQLHDDVFVRDVASWNALIAGFVQYGRGEETLQCYHAMQSEGLSPDKITFTCILKACGSLGAAKQVHKEIVKLGLLGKDIVLGTALVDMYAKYGALQMAEQVLNELQIRDVFSWTAVITGYVQYGLGKEALNYFEQMQLEGVFPNAVTFISILKICGALKAIDKGKEIHDDIVRLGLVGADDVLGTALVNMYAKCGELAKAAQVLDELQLRDVASSNALITGYVQEGMGEEALHCFEQLRHKGLSPNVVTFTTILKACGIIGALDKGEEIHKEIARQGLLEKDLALANSLVDMYAKCGALKQAKLVLDERPIRDIVSCSSLIAGYVQHGLDEEAIKCLDWMQIEGLSPDAITLASIAKVNHSRGAADKGEPVDSLSQGFHSIDNVQGIMLLGKCIKRDPLAKAARLHDELYGHDVVFWNALIASYIEHGQDEEALKCFERMQYGGCIPDAVTFVSILKVCSSSRAADMGKSIHSEIVRQGLLGKDAVLGTALMDFYAKSGALSKAVQVHDELPVHDTVSWGALILGYAYERQSEEVFIYFEHMLYEGLSPNSAIFMAILKACGNVGATNKGDIFHNEIVKHGLLGKDILLDTTLVDMYAKCGAFADATRVLAQLRGQSIVSWNALVVGYVQHGCGLEALQCLEQMKSESVLPDTVTFTWMLKACCSMGASDKGEKIHNEITGQGLLGKDIILDSNLIDMYAKCGALAKAALVLDELPVRSALCWNVVIAGYVEQGLNEEALYSLERMQLEGLSPDIATFICVLKACGRVGAAERGKQIHNEVVRQGLPGNNLLLENTLVAMYAKCGVVASATQMVEKSVYRDVVSWSVLIAAYAQCGKGEEACKCFLQMQQEGLFPDKVSFISILKACGSIGAVDRGEQVHHEICINGLLTEDVVIGNTLVDMYAKCDAIGKARRVLLGLPARDVVSWNTIITGYAQRGECEEAFKCFEQMKDEGLSPDTVTFICLLKACRSTGASDRGEWVHNEILRKGLLQKDIVLGSALVDMYARCGVLKRAAQVLHQLPVQGIIPWSALIAGYAQQGQAEAAVKCFEQMLSKGLFPDCVSFGCLLIACSHSGLVEEGQRCFARMSSEFGITPNIQHYSSMVDLFCRAGEHDKALALIQEMPSFNQFPVWTALLSAFRESGSVKSGELAFGSAIQLDDHDYPGYVPICNTCAVSGMEKDGGIGSVFWINEANQFNDASRIAWLFVYSKKQRYQTQP